MLEKKFHFLQICIFIHFLRPFKKHKIYLKLKKVNKCMNYFRILKTNRDFDGLFLYPMHEKKLQKMTIS